MKKMKDSGVAWIGEIPSNWALVRVKNQYSSHKTIAGSDSEKYERLALTLNGVIKRSKEDSNGLQPEAFDGYQVLNTGELVFKLIDLANVATSRVGYSPYTGIVSPAYIILSPNKDAVAKFGEKFFLSMWQREVFNHMGDDGVRSSLNVSDLLNIPYPHPPLPEQQRIADFLDRKCADIDNILEKIKASIEEYKKLKQSVIDESVSKGIQQNRPMKKSGVEWVGDIPSEWSVIKCSRLFQENVRTPDSSDTPLSLSQADGLIPTDDMKESSLKTSTYEGWKKVVPNDLVLNRFKGHLGVLFCSDYVGMVSFHYGVFEAVADLSPKYFEYLFHSTAYKAILANKSNGMTVGLQNLSNQNFYSIQCICPSYHEQLTIATYLNEKCAKIDSLIESKERFITELESYKKSLIYEYVTGKKEVPSNA